MSTHSTRSARPRASRGPSRRRKTVELSGTRARVSAEDGAIITDRQIIDSCHRDRHRGATATLIAFAEDKDRRSRAALAHLAAPEAV